MHSSDLKNALPTTDELPCSDDTPVDNEDQNFLPNVLLFLLNSIWATRMNWYFGVNMAVYHTKGVNPKVPVVPDAFLSLEVERKKSGKSRKSYVVWEENEIVPILALEIVSHIPRGEYDEKLAIYRQLSVLYYVIYNPEFWQRDQHQPFEIYKLIDENYQLQIGEPYWMPEVGLGIARYQGIIGGIQQEALSWYDDQGDRYFTAEERAEQENIRAEKLAEYLHSLGIDPDYLPNE
ncbi:MAG: Uma2 family endonuclease [Mojavia pulchra JT2-VF2]|jgi:Uma2 family endonuclease|uniref:Uma2 family endonuclease n=1 Tax=Mojavia pulchra JT2-VF2 TaxID=287848 RepID=A0A951PXN2_9NOST|nr:Uma2 family endonuclease [Mojavia pulchra JT2-VF2]